MRCLSLYWSLFQFWRLIFFSFFHIFNLRDQRLEKIGMICFRHWYLWPARQAWAAWAAEVCGSRWAESMSGVVPPIAIIMDTSHDERERERGGGGGEEQLLCNTNFKLRRY